MPDLADQADALVAEHLALSMARLPAVIPAGIAGECDDCGEDMPRLVDGRCGFCRDGRRPPAAAYERRSAAVVVPSKAQEEAIMTKTSKPDSKVISVPVEGALLAAVTRHAATYDLPLGRAMRELAEARLFGGEPHPVGATPPADLAAIPLDELIEEIGDRLRDLIERPELDRWIARAETAEQKLASIRAAVGDGA